MQIDKKMIRQQTKNIFNNLTTQTQQSGNVQQRHTPHPNTQMPCNGLKTGKYRYDAKSKTQAQQNSPWARRDVGIIQSIIFEKIHVFS